MREIELLKQQIKDQSNTFEGHQAQMSKLQVCSSEKLDTLSLMLLGGCCFRRNWPSCRVVRRSSGRASHLRIMFPRCHLLSARPRVGLVHYCDCVRERPWTPPKQFLFCYLLDEFTRECRTNVISLCLFCASYVVHVLDNSELSSHRLVAEPPIHRITTEPIHTIGNLDVRNPAIWRL